MAVGSLHADVKSSRMLLPTGVDTALIRGIDDTINNPLPRLFQLLSDIDDKFIEFLKARCEGFLTYLGGELEAVFYLPQSNSSITYLLALKEDSPVKRDMFFDFIDTYEETGMSKKHPIRFQFFPKNYIDRMTEGERIIL